MHTYIVKAIHNVAPDMLVLTLEPKGNGVPLQFVPGQYVSLGFKRGFRPSPMRCFSIASSPTRRELQFAMRIAGPFTSSMAQLRPGEKVYLQGPFGDFVIDTRYDKQVVMLAGGIGITPFMSMLRYGAETKQQIPTTLLYACRSLRDIPFLQEILALAQQNPLLRVVFFVSDSSTLPGHASATVIPSRIIKEHLATVAKSYPRATYFLCGPQPFMQAQTKKLQQLSVAADQIISESFTQQAPAAWGGLSLQKLTYSLALGAFVLGFGTIMTLDLAQHLPKVSAASQQTTQSSQTTSANSLNTSNASSNTSSSTLAPTTTTTPTTDSTSASSQSYYQPPVSSVS